MRTRSAIPFMTSVLLVGCMHSASLPSRPIGVSTEAPFTTLPTELDDSDPEALALFRPELQPYGRWVEDAVAGTVWIPRKEEVGEGFVPYASHGHFAYREVSGTPDFIWVSDVPWGWVTFHYGRWAYLARRGSWAWIPGRRYSGAWVTFRLGEGCMPHASTGCAIGWGPRAPHVAWHGEETIRRPAETALFVYARAKDLFDEDLSSRLLRGDDLELASRKSHLAVDVPRLTEIGVPYAASYAPPVYDADLRKAWLYSTPDAARAMGLFPTIGRRPLRTFVAGGPHYQVPEDDPR